MAIYKITYRISGDETYRDVNVESSHPLTPVDDKVIEATRRDSVNYQKASTTDSVFGITVVTITEVI
ncbi:hypothetical protein M8320_09015 [Leclercia sp. H6W5]|uniref:hypothetical protein n=1 Tax=Leclercia tamurae TaxID=2926467 RepID=UPI0021D15F4D|nr:hypothetical protein [Leclercia tamurae]MCU6682142.1 hypothetical protein [Leclercia tamurae]